MPIPFNNTSEYISTTYMKGLMKPENETSAEPKPVEAPKYHSIFDTNKNEIIESTDAEVASHLKENCKITESSNEYIKTNLSSQVENFVKNAMDALGKFSFKYTAGTYNPFNIMKIESEGTIKEAETQLETQTQSIKDHMQRAYDIAAKDLQVKAEQAKEQENALRTAQEKQKMERSNLAQFNPINTVRYEKLKDSILGVSSDHDKRNRHTIVMNDIKHHNVVEVLDQYQNDVGRSLLDDIGEETGYKKDDRINEAYHICYELLVRAKSAMIPDNQLQYFKNELNIISQTQKDAFNYDFSQFDTIVNGLTSLIKTYESIPAETRIMVSNMDSDSLNGLAFSNIKSSLDGAINTYTNFRDGEGFFSDAINGGKELGNDGLELLGVSEFFTSRSVTEETLQQYGNDVERLEAAKNGTLKDDKGNPISFEQEFKRIYGMKPDAIAILNFNNVKGEYQQYCALSNRANSAETIANGIHPTLTIYTTQGPFGMSSAATYEAQEADFNNSYEKILNYFGGEENLKIACEALNINFPLSGTPKEKLEALKTLMQNESKKYSNLAKKVSNGLSSEQLKNKYDKAYTAAYGTQNDAAKAVAEYTDSQSSALAIAKGVVIAAMTLVPGGAVVTGFLTAGASLAFNGIEAGTNNKEETREEIEQILNEAVKTGLTVGAAKLVASQINIVGNKIIAKYVPETSTKRAFLANATKEGIMEGGKSTVENLTAYRTDDVAERIVEGAGEYTAERTGKAIVKKILKRG